MVLYIVDFTFDQDALTGQTVVVFETLMRDDIEVVVHHDINDLEQTPELPTAKTKASFVERDMQSPNMVTLQDKTCYTGLIVGNEYRLETVLRDRHTGEPIIIDGEVVSSTTIFVAESKDGCVISSVTFDQNKLITDSVNFAEYGYDGDRLIFLHDDLEDKDQTVENITVQINKKDRLTKERLMKAEFTMYDAEGNVNDVKWTDENGIASFTIFEGETVEIKETNAPEGYLLSDEVIRLTGEKGIDGNLYTIEYYNDMMPVISLPATGIGSSPLLLVGLLLLLVGAFVIYRSHKLNINFSTYGISMNENQDYVDTAEEAVSETKAMISSSINLKNNHTNMRE
ncbi:VaFE repeat-containing surface-anchored protein [Erysipelothrix aquatica]|uniref:VaFE repeat-containing surface-anchored protein n=1 Tax=Erysipelothrix aquatica TaxID=2683714 RepID=UPI001357CB4C|nr:VaFE repeat-containing surface-anchored protein [Erysipelothrix aquatica]